VLGTPSQRAGIVTGARAGETGSLAVLRAIQLLFGAACVEVAVALIFELGPAETVTNGTSVRILGAALIALAFGAFSTVKDPYRHRTVFRIEIVFTALTAVSLIYRLVTDHHTYDPAWLLLPPVVTCLVLLLVFAPRSGDEKPPVGG